MSRKKLSFKSSLDMSAVLPHTTKFFSIRTLLVVLAVAGTMIIAVLEAHQ